MEQYVMLLLPFISAIIVAFVFTLIFTMPFLFFKGRNIKVKNAELHVGKHHWFKVEYK